VEESGDAVLTLAWSPNRPILASGGADNAVRLWDSQDGASIAVLRAHSDWVRAVVWSPDGRLLASASEDKTVCIWRDLFAGNHSDIADGEMVVAADPLVLSGHSDWVRCLAWSPHGRLLASGSDDASIRVWDVGTSTCEQLLESRGGAVTSVAFAGKGMLLLAQTTRRDDAFQCWQVRTWQEIFSIPVSPSRVEIARNLDAIIAEFPDLVDTRIVDRSPADRLVEGAAYLGARNFGLGAIVTTALELSDDDPYFLGEDLGESGAYTKEVTDERALAVILDSALALNRAYAINYDRTLCYESLSDILVTWGKEAGELALWRVHAEQFAEIRTEPVTRYTNARAVLIGETGVGKTCLGRALMGEAFIPQESTAGRTVWVLQNETVPIEPLLSEEHELLLWDMPGQQGYRVVHQLYLDDVTVALLVFDSLDETGSFGEVYYWERALRQAQQLLGRTPRSQKVFLVAARVDRAGVGVSQERVDRIVSELHLDGFYRTSALEGTGIEELRQVIIQAVAWERILKVTSTELFHSIKQFLVREKEMGRLLSTVDDLYRAFTLTRTGIEETRGLRHDFDICVDRVAQVGLIQRFSWGNYVLLQPELLDAYTSALVTSARDEPDGLGSISKADVLAGSFAIPQDLRIRVPTEVEQSLLVAMVEELIRRDLALAQQTQKGEFLVFPAQTQRERPEFPDPRGQAVRYDFEGAVTNLYATLAVRLARSTIFTQPEIYRNAIQYTATSGGTCGLVLSNRGEGVASLTLFFGEETQAVTRVIFEEFVVDHLRTGLAVRREPIFRCSKPGCGLTTITPEVAQAIRAQGRTTATCHVCGTLIPLLESRERLNGPVTDEIAKLNTEIDKARNQEAWVMVRRATQNYDVFFSYNSTDSKAVKAIAKRLIEKGVMPWLYEWDQVGGKRFLPEIERAIQICRAGVYFEGDNGEGAWQEEEADALIRETKQRAGFSVIPVILPEASQVPEFPHFLKNRVRIDLRAGEDDALSALMQAITGLPIGLLEALRR
jgi:small GTP-binding protein